ncbi:ATP-binding protein [Kitasatospora sp. NPDC087315]|uniref:ATP-binding protein n=1 Tax=Kitasatospora sp. NPDC087315 TaxID=3364069 RepID=UPI003802511D
MTASPSFAPHHERPPLRASVLALLTTALATGAVVAVSTAAAPASVRSALGWGAGAGALLLCVAVTAATYAVQTSRVLGRRVTAARQEADQLRHERDRLADETAREHARLADETARRSAELADERTRLIGEHARETARLTEQARLAAATRAAAIAACANAAGRMQAMATGLLADLREMEERHTDENVLGDLLHLDHRTAQAGRLADSVAVLTGARSGRRWARPIGMESVLRGAMGRISGYQRVRLHSVGEVAVVGHAAEGVMHVLAELLDNAAKFSPPTAEVHVYVEQVPAGALVSVEDSGLVMGDVQLRRAERAVRGEATGLGGLSGTRLGLSVVGRLARKHGLTVSFRPSARGGTGVLVLVPQELLSRAAAPHGTAPAKTPAVAAGVGRPAPRAVTAGTAPGRAEPVPAREAPAPDDGNGALPHRRRGQTLAAAESARHPAVAPTERPQGGVKAGMARFSTFRQAVRTASPDGVRAPEKPDDPSTTTGHIPAPHPHPEGDTPR